METTEDPTVAHAAPPRRKCQHPDCHCVPNGRWCRFHHPTAIAFRADPDDPRHGSANGYGNLRCRCDRCTAAWAVYHGNYMHAHPEQREKHRDRGRTGTWGAPVAYLADGYRTDTGVARLLGVNKTTLRRMTGGIVTPKGRRLWSPDDVRNLAVDLLARRFAATIRAHGKVLDATGIAAALALATCSIDRTEGQP